MAQSNVTVVPAGTSPEFGSAVTGETLALSFTVTSQVTGVNEPHSAVMVHVPAPSAFMVALVVALSGVTLTIFSLSDFHVTGGSFGFRAFWCEAGGQDAGFPNPQRQAWTVDLNAFGFLFYGICKG